MLTQAISANIYGKGGILTVACLTFGLLLTYRPIPGLSEYKLKVVNIWEMHGTGVLKMLCLTDFSDMSKL